MAGSEEVGVQGGAESSLLAIGSYPGEGSVWLTGARFEGENRDFRPAKVMVSAGRNLRSEVRWENQKR